LLLAHTVGVSNHKSNAGNAHTVKSKNKNHAYFIDNGKVSAEVALGMTSRSPDQRSPKRIHELNRGYWTIENRRHYVIDWNFDEDRSRIRTGNGPENISRLRRFAVGVIQFISDGKSSVAQKMQQLNRNTRLVFDYLRMTFNSTQPCLL